MNILKAAVIGNGFQVRNHHLPYLLNDRKEEVAVCWASGCTCLPAEIPGCPFCNTKLVGPLAGNKESWRQLLKTQRPDAVIISTPNSTHEEIVRTALMDGIHVAVDKPPTLDSRSCAQLVALAKEKGCVFLTISQRRYEEVYLLMQKRLAADDLGEIRQIHYFIGNSFGPQGWRKKKSMAGGGILMDSAYHGIDAILWLLKQAPVARHIHPVTVSCDWILDTTEKDPAERIEMIGAMRIVMSNGCLFNVAASYENPKGSVDEVIKIFGKAGSMRYVRDELEKGPMSAGRLTFQQQDGQWIIDHKGDSTGKRWAPLEDFLDAILAGRTSVTSPASDSIPVLRILNAAYESATKGGVPVSI